MIIPKIAVKFLLKVLPTCKLSYKILLFLPVKWEKVPKKVLIWKPQTPMELFIVRRTGSALCSQSSSYETNIVVAFVVSRGGECRQQTADTQLVDTNITAPDLRNSYTRARSVPPHRSVPSVVSSACTSWSSPSSTRGPVTV